MIPFPSGWSMHSAHTWVLPDCSGGEDPLPLLLKLYKELIKEKGIRTKMQEAESDPMLICMAIKNKQPKPTVLGIKF